MNAKKNDNSDTGRIGYSDIYKGLWKCRDFELAHCWQRSVFLTAFLLACYAGYGALIMQCLTIEETQLPFRVVNGIAFCICVVGILLSLLWIMMAKGSKAWYEKYESAINTFVDRYKEKNVFKDDLSEVAGFGIIWCENFQNQRRSDWLWKIFCLAYKRNHRASHSGNLVWTCAYTYFNYQM